MNHFHDKINDYFLKKNVHVIYNMLGRTPELAYSYVNTFSKFLSANGIKRSQHYKTQCYNQLYQIEARPKFTGFEKYEKLDKKFRRTISPLVNQSQFTPTLIIDHYDIKESDKLYKQVLKEAVKNVNKPLLYLSGGIDSELVAMAMIEADVKFTPVIFNYIDIQGQTLNLFDIAYAYKFCQQYGLFPIVKSINIEELWNSKEFASLAIELGITSPQLVTHAYMVEIMADDFKDYTHVFGGEVRFETDFIAPDTYKPANLVYLNKTISSVAASYVDEDTSSPYSLCQLTTYANPGPSYNLQTFTLFESGVYSDIWYTVTGTPSPTFFVEVTPNYQYGGSGCSYTPSSPTGYSAISGQAICTTTNGSSGVVAIQVIYNISIYGSVGGVGTAQSGSVTHTAIHSA